MVFGASSSTRPRKHSRSCPCDVHRGVPGCSGAGWLTGTCSSDLTEAVQTQYQWRVISPEWERLETTSTSCLGLRGRGPGRPPARGCSQAASRVLASGKAGHAGRCSASLFARLLGVAPGSWRLAPPGRAVQERGEETPRLTPQPFRNRTRKSVDEPSPQPAEAGGLRDSQEAGPQWRLPATPQQDAWSQTLHLPLVKIKKTCFCSTRNQVEFALRCFVQGEVERAE